MNIVMFKREYLFNKLKTKPLNLSICPGHLNILVTHSFLMPFLSLFLPTPFVALLRPPLTLDRRSSLELLESVLILSEKHAIVLFLLHKEIHV